jgi:molybdopterin-guanine dinucleotide biosynthesis protein A
MTGRVSVVVLAGGRSRRFGRDKLAEPIDGRSLLVHAIDAVRPLAGEIVVVAAPGTTPAVPADVVVVHDPVAFDGPLAGARVGLGAATGSIALVVGGDMPDPSVEVLASMIALLEASEAVTSVVLEHDGRPRPLPMAVRRDAALLAAAQLLETGERRLRAIIGSLATEVIDERTWRSLDPDGRTVRDIDTESDLG